MNALALLRARELNPVLVKEMRQAVRSLLLLTVFCLLLAGLTLGSFLFFAATVLTPQGGAPTREVVGPIYLALIAGGLQCAVLLGGIATFFRAKQEREPGRADLLYITTLSPGAIVRGKWGASLAFAGTMVSLGLPFMVIAYFLRGVSLGDIGLAFASLAGAALLVNLFAILVATLPCSGGLKHLLFWPTLVFGLFYLGPSLAALAFLRASAVSSPSTAVDALWIVVKTVLATGTELWVMYALAVFCLSPSTANRAKRLRLTLTGLTLFWMGLVFAQNSQGWTILVLVILEMLLLAGLVFGLGAGAQLSRRVRREVAPRWPARLFALFFFEGVFFAMLWAAALAGLQQAWLALGRALLGASMPDFWGTTARVSLLLNGYFLVYALCALALHQRVPRISVTAAFAGVVTVGSILPLCFIPLFSPTWTQVNFPLLGNLAACAWESQRAHFFGVHLIFMGCAAGLALWLSRARIAGALRELKPLPPVAGPAVTPPPAVVPPEIMP